jgi:hypothetical protein
VRWDAVADAAQYTVQIAASEDFAGAQEVRTTAPSLAQALAGAARTVFVRVRAEASCGTSSPWSPAVQVGYLGACAGGGHAYYLPSVAGGRRGVGASVWFTDLSLLNASGGSAAVSARFFGDHEGSGSAVIAAGQQAGWVDAVRTLFGVTAEDAGFALIESSQPLAVFARTYARATEGATTLSYGQLVRGQQAGEALAPGAVGYLPHLRSDGAFRTNVEVINAGTAAGTVEVRLRGREGAELAVVAIPVEPGRRVQRTAVLPAGHAFAFAEVRVAGEGARILAMASVVDGSSNDPVTIPLVVP